MQIDRWTGGLRDPHWWARLLGFAAAVGALLGVIGPFGSFLNDELLVRVLYFVAMTISGAVVLALLVPPLLHAGLRVGLPLWFALTAALVLVAVPNTGISWVVGHRLWGRAVGKVTVAEWYEQTVLLTACIVGLWVLLERVRHATTQHRVPDAAPAGTVAPDPHEPVLCLQMEDHYVRVHRRSGSSLELMPLHLAIERFGGAGGVQVHRSWWVATAAIESAERDARNWRLRLSNGMTVPVARNRVAEMRARGWIADEARAAV